MKYLFLALLVSACGQSGNNQSVTPFQLSELAGSWVLQSGSCNGQPVDIGDLQEVFIVTGQSASVTDYSESSNCLVQDNDLELSLSGNDIEMTDGTLDCESYQTISGLKVLGSTSSCNIQIGMPTGQSTVSVSNYACDENFPFDFQGPVTYQVSGNTMQRFANNGCIFTYSK